MALNPKTVRKNFEGAAKNYDKFAESIAKIAQISYRSDFTVYMN